MSLHLYLPDFTMILMLDIALIIAVLFHLFKG